MPDPIDHPESSRDAGRRPAPGSRAPTGQPSDQVDELDLLGWVEGDLPRARQQPVEELLAREPRLRALLESMASDRGVIRGLGTEQAPPGLLAGVEARLERDLLVGLAGTNADVADIPVSRVVMKRPRGNGVLARIGLSGRSAPLLRTAAVAAGLVIVGTVGLTLRLPRPGEDSAHRATPPVLIGAAGEPEESTITMTPERSLAENTGSEAIAEETTPSLGVLALDTAAPAAELSNADESISLNRAVELLRENRLAIVVRTLDRDRTLERLASIHAEPRPTWSLLDRADQELVSAIVPAVAEHGPEAPAISPQVLADGSIRAPEAHPAAAHAKSSDITARIAPSAWSVYLAESDATTRAVGALRGALNSGRTQAAHFVALEAPLPNPPASSIDAVLWWNRPPSGWVRRYTLPVVVNPVEQR